MSLKAKLEAVIYAAEEPVTLAQLAALFAAEALEHKAAQAAQDEPLAEPVPLIEEPAPIEVAEIAAEPTAQAAGEEGGAATTDAESEAKREAKARDREVKAILKGILAELISNYDADDRGVEIREIAGGYRMATKPSCHDAVRLFVKSLKPPMKLSLPALETLAVIAYKQPVTAPEVSEIRGVESGGVLGSLMARKLIATAGRKQVIGRPILYKTTKEFLLRFGLKDLSELPSMEEFEKIAAIEIDEMEPAETALSENASNPEEPGPDEINPDETSPQAETEAAPDAPQESSSKEVRAEEGSGEEIRSEESSGEEVSEPQAKENR
ncbi:MAG TPA: SMC-Scp complex subunit ScpB [Terracidiphilus sp.]|jgi:segregation and condensation protein B